LFLARSVTPKGLTVLFIEFARRQKRWTQKDLGDACRIHQHFISMIERGIGLPVPDQLARLARELDLPPEKVLQPVPDLTEVPVAAENGRG